MAYDVSRFSDQELQKLEQRMVKVYSECSKDLQTAWSDYIFGYDEGSIHHRSLAEREAIEKDAMTNKKYGYAKMTDQQAQDHFNQWRINQIARGQRWTELRGQMTDRLVSANQICQDYVNGKLPGIYAQSSNVTAITVQKAAIDQGVTGLRFDLVDENTVKRLMAGSHEVRPYKPIEINTHKDTKWNQTKLQNALLEGILQGDAIDKIADRFQAVTGMNRSQAVRNARTTVTGAENAGKQDRYDDLTDQGVEMTKIWVATEDDRTRQGHADADGQEVDQNMPFLVEDADGILEDLMYPGDPNGSPSNIYNCRCTTKIGQVKFKSIMSDKLRAKANIREYSEMAEKQSELSELLKQQQKKEKALDKLSNYSVSGIWKNDVDISEWKSKEQSIPLKRDYYNAEKAKAIAAGDTAKVAEIDAKLAQLAEFDKNGKKWYKLSEEKRQIDKAVKDKQMEINILNGYDPAQDAFSQARKDAALWAKDTKEADDVLRDVSGEVWRNAPKPEKQAIYDYTGTYHPYNEPLRGIQYGLGGTKQGFKGVGNVDLNSGGRGSSINLMTQIINKSSYEEDIWIQRGCRFPGMDNFFGIAEDLLRNGSQTDLEQALLGKQVTEYGFMSCGVAKGKGFGGDIILNIYAPSGTNMMYVEPFSQYGGDSKGMKWDGLSTQNYFGSESEIILQQGTRFEITKVERVNGKIYVDMDVIGREAEQVWVP